MKARICKEKHWNVHLRFFFVMMGALLFSASVLAQSNLITGKVIDNANEPIIGASIQSSVAGKGKVVGGLDPDPLPGAGDGVTVGLQQGAPLAERAAGNP